MSYTGEGAGAGGWEVHVQWKGSSRAGEFLYSEVQV